MAETPDSTQQATPDNSALAGAPSAPISAAELPGAPATAVAPAAPLVGPMADVSLPTTTGPGTPTAPTPVAPRNPRPWANILEGALWGLTGVTQTKGRGSFATGLAQGAGAEVEQATRQAQTQSSIRFQSAQAASLTAEAAVRNRQLTQMGQDAEDLHNKNAIDTMKELQTNGIPFQVVGRDSGSVTAFMQKQTAQNGGVPPYSVLHIGDQFIAVDLNQLGQGNQMLPIINHYEKAAGQPQTSPALLGQMAPAAKGQLFDTALHYFNPIITTQGQLDDAMNRAATLEKAPDYPEKADDLSKLNGVISTAKDVISKNASEAETRRLQTVALNENDARTITTAPSGQFTPDRVKQAQDWLDKNEAEKTRIYGTEHTSKNPVYAVGKDGKTVLTTQGAVDATPGDFTAVRGVKQTDVSKDQHDIKVLNDIQTKSDNVRADSAVMDDTSWKDSLALAKYLSDNPNTTSDTLTKSAIFKQASKPAQKYAIDALSLRETSMGLQKVLTGTARNNETQLQALLATLPGIEPNSDIVNQKLNAFNQNLGMLTEGLPGNTGVEIKVHPNPTAPGTAAAGGKVVPPGGQAIRDRNHAIVGYVLNGKRTDF